MVKVIIALQEQHIHILLNVQPVLILTTLIEQQQQEELLLVFNVQQDFTVKKEVYSQQVCAQKVIIALQEQQLNMNSLVQLEHMLISLVSKHQQNVSPVILETTVLLEVHIQLNVQLEPIDRQLELKQQVELLDVLPVLLVKFAINLNR